MAFIIKLQFQVSIEGEFQGSENKFKEKNFFQAPQ